MLAANLNCYKILYWPLALVPQWPTRPVMESSAAHGPRWGPGREEWWMQCPLLGERRWFWPRVGCLACTWTSLPLLPQLQIPQSTWNGLGQPGPIFLYQRRGLVSTQGWACRSQAEKKCVVGREGLNRRGAQASAAGPPPRGCSQTRDPERLGDALGKHHRGQVRVAPRAPAMRLQAAPAVPAARTARLGRETPGRSAAGRRVGNSRRGRGAGRAGGRRCSQGMPRNDRCVFVGRKFDPWALSCLDLKMDSPSAAEASGSGRRAGSGSWRALQTHRDPRDPRGSLLHLPLRSGTKYRSLTLVFLSEPPHLVQPSPKEVMLCQVQIKKPVFCIIQSSVCPKELWRWKNKQKQTKPLRREFWHLRIDRCYFVCPLNLTVWIFPCTMHSKIFTMSFSWWQKSGNNPTVHQYIDKMVEYIVSLHTKKCSFFPRNTL